MCEVIPHCDFYLCFANDIEPSFHGPVGHLHILFGKMSLSVLLSIFKSGCLGFFVVDLYELFIYLGY